MILVSFKKQTNVVLLMFLKCFANRKPSLNKALRRIESSTDREITDIIAAVIKRYHRIFPDWEILFLSVPKDPAQRNQQLEMMLEQLKSGELK